MKMTLAALTCALPLFAFPALAQDIYQPPAAEDGFGETSPQGSADEGLESMLERGAQKLLGDLFRDIEPHMDAITRDLSLRMNELSPVFKDLGNLMDDMANYQAPERLENGDILIRRKADAPPPPVVSRRLQDLVDPDADPGADTNPDAVPGPDNTGTGEVEL